MKSSDIRTISKKIHKAFEKIESLLKILTDPNKI